MQGKLLENKVAVVYGGGGIIGGAVARALASEGARVFLAGRRRESLDAVARRISQAGGFATVAVADALDEAAVERHFASVSTQRALSIFASTPSHMETSTAVHS